MLNARYVDKTIKLWKVHEKTTTVVAENNAGTASQRRPINTSQMFLPKLTKTENIIHASARKVFANAHAYHINSISINSDCETYISADDLRVNLWNLNQNNESFSKTHGITLYARGVDVLLDIVDIKPANMEELTEVITASEFHPLHCNEFIYSSSKGSIKLADMRMAALCDRQAKGMLICRRASDCTYR